MAVILIVGLVPVLRELVRDLSFLTDHAAILPADWRAVPARRSGQSADIILLEAGLPAWNRDAWTRHAADLNAVVIYYADALTDGELRSFAAARNAPYFTLPNGPRRFKAVVGDALARRDERHREDSEDAIRRMDAAMHARLNLLTLLAQARARVAIDDAARTRARSRELRGERDTVLAEVRARREGLRDAVVMMARAMRSAGAPPERTLTLMRDALLPAGRSADNSADTTELLEETDRWVLDAYAVA